MPINSSGNAQSIISVVQPQSKIVAVLGNAYTTNQSPVTSVTGLNGVYTNPSTGNVNVVGFTATNDQIGVVKPDGTTITVTEDGTISAVGGGGGSGIAVDGTTVPPTGGVVNFQDSTDFYNRILFSNPDANNVRASLDFTSSVICSDLTVTNASGNTGISIDAPNAGAVYSIVLPPAQGGANTTLINDGSGNLSWGASAGAGVTSVTSTNSAITATTTSGSVSLTANPATSSALGVVRSDNLSIVNTAGVLSVPTATTTALGIARGDNSSIVNTAGILSVPTASTTTLGIARADNSTIINTNGVLSGGAISVGGTQLNGVVTLIAGANTSITTSGNNVTITATGGGGGGGFSSVIARWTGAGNANKNAFTSPGVANTDGITMLLTASSNPGTLTTANVTLTPSTGTAQTINNVAITGTFPNYSLAIVSGSINNSVQTAPSVTVQIVIGSSFNLTANNLTNTQPTAFNAVLTGNFAQASYPYYTSTGVLNYGYTTTGTGTSFAGTFTASGQTFTANTSSGSFINFPISTASIGGTATGNGLAGAGSSTVNLSGSVSPVVYIPAFYTQTSSSANPGFTTGSAQTTGGAQGSTIVYPVAIASTQYNWVGTTRPLSALKLQTPFGQTQLVPDVATTQALLGQLLNVYGWTSLTVGQASTLVIS